MVQSNWKFSEHWVEQISKEQLEKLFASMRSQFDPDANVFKKAKDAGQLLKQGEIDVVGIGQDGSIHALEVAFHEAGLNYGGGLDKRVLKKLLRMVIILKAYHPAGTKLHIYFVSPKVNQAGQQSLEDIFADLNREYPEIEWHLLTNEEFASEVLHPTVEKAGSVADTSELFVRAAKLLELTGVDIGGSGRKTGTRDAATRRSSDEVTTPDIRQVQPLVQDLMKTLLEDFPTLLDDSDRRNLMDKEHCKTILGLRIGNYPLLRLREEGGNGYNRYYKDVYGGQFHVCSQWAKTNHFHNAGSLLRLVNGLIDRRQGHPGIAELERHRSELERFVG